jgi:hypothetical protein
MLRIIASHAWILLPSLAIAQPDPPDLRGSWKLELRAANHVQMPVLGPNTVRSHQIMLVEIRGEGQLIQSHSVCSLEVRSDHSFIETIIPDSWVAALPDKEYPLQIDPMADGGWSYKADLLPLRIGFDPAITDDELPLDLDAPGVIDWDGDGKPAATVYLDLHIFGKVEVYLVQAANTHLDGLVESSDSVRGQMLTPELRQRTIGATNRLFVTNPVVVPYPPESTFSMVRVPAGSTCEDLLK